MLSSAEITPLNDERSGTTSLSRLWDWNRRLHYFIGLYFLFFIWLFCFTGLLLNHSTWRFAEFWENRKQSLSEHQIVAPPAGSDLVQARDVMRQIGLAGEIDWVVTRSDNNRLDFRVSRPGHILDLKSDLSRGVTAVERIDLNAWGVMRIMHTFTGVRLDDSRNQRDWIVTWIWSLAMDALAVGLIVIVLGGILFWYERGRQRLSGAIVLLAGVLACGLFCYGLRWLF